MRHSPRSRNIIRKTKQARNQNRNFLSSRFWFCLGPEMGRLLTKSLCSKQQSDPKKLGKKPLFKFRHRDLKTQRKSGGNRDSPSVRSFACLRPLRAGVSMRTCSIAAARMCGISVNRLPPSPGTTTIGDLIMKLRSRCGIRHFFNKKTNVLDIDWFRKKNSTTKFLTNLLPNFAAAAASHPAKPVSLLFEIATRHHCMSWQYIKHNGRCRRVLSISSDGK